MKQQDTFAERGEAAKKAAAKMREYFKLKFRASLSSEANGHCISHNLIDLFKTDDIYQGLYDYTYGLRDLLLFLREIKNTDIYKQHKLEDSEKCIDKLHDMFEVFKLEESHQLELEYYNMIHNYAGEDTVAGIEAIEAKFDIKVKAYKYELELLNQLEEKRKIA